jgi:hypothetical protein
VFEKRVLRRIFGLKRDAVSGGWRKQHNEENHKFYSSPNILRMVKPRDRLCALVVRVLGYRSGGPD